MPESTTPGEVIVEHILKYATEVTAGPMNSEVAKITALLEVLKEVLKKELDLGGQERWLYGRLCTLPEKLREVHRGELANRVEDIRQELIHRTAPV